MKYLSIDIETTGLDSERHQILSVGVIIEDTENKLSFSEIPKFHCAIVRDELVGSLYALNLNKELISSICDWREGNEETKKNIEDITGITFLKEEDVVPSLFRFLYSNNMLDISLYDFNVNKKVEVISGKSFPLISSVNIKTKLNVAGKNFGTFDKLFLEKLPRFKQVFRINQRIIDPAVLFMDWENDKELPNLKTCKERVGNSDVVTHNAVEDAFDVIELLRTKY